MTLCFGPPFAFVNALLAVGPLKREHHARGQACQVTVVTIAILVMTALAVWCAVGIWGT
jgi:hypothetical protein